MNTRNAVLFMKRFCYFASFFIIVYFNLFAIDIPVLRMQHVFLIIFIPIITISLEIFLSIFLNKKAPVFFIGADNYNMSYFITVIFMAIAEEYIFRLLIFDFFLEKLQCELLVVMLLSAFAYGFNHIHFGLAIFVSKFLIGIIYFLVFFIFKDFYCVVLIHVLSNIIVFGLSFLQIKGKLCF
ncbi:CPBP family intramembrane metalloprotease (plasmid) [Borreliella valaisiana]|uniref:CPBP family intramembrane glutamic endopeptidase n=1 Tax=Borreliella valaisiana TaxID=62088 RepID=UPI00273803CE|nr:CPBP family intramembrane glutamic endopeptidase [Borreliella valaisiana]WLN25770.1 CPBP family intramembrane metalloprotease [Borreliella valaisiana]